MGRCVNGTITVTNLTNVYCTMAKTMLLGRCANGTVTINATLANIYCTLPTASCSHSLVFSQACNSAYIGLL